MSPVSEQKCPNCGGATRFDPARGKYVCDFCGTVFAIAPQKPADAGSQWEGFDFSKLTEQALHPDAADLPVCRCVSCGAEVITPPEQAALTCPYCGNNLVLTDRITGKLRPDGILPFRIQSQDLPAAVNRFYRDKKLLPKGFFSAATMGRVTGVYIPFWVFRGRIGGIIRFRATTSSSSRKGDYVYTTTKYYQLDREAGLAFEDIPVDASMKVDDKLMDSLEPFDMTQVQGFDTRYLAGFTADRFDQSPDDIASRAKVRMQNSITDITRANTGRGYSSVRYASSQLRSDLQVQYLLFPVYLFDIMHERKSYHFAVSGQPGKVVGKLPLSTETSIWYFLKRAGVVSGALILLSFARYMLGF